MTQSIKGVLQTKSFGKFIRSLRRLKDVRLADVAKETGLSQAALSKMEKEELFPKDCAVVRKIAHLLDADEDELLKLLLKARLFRCQVQHELKMERLTMNHTIAVKGMAE